MLLTGLILGAAVVGIIAAFWSDIVEFLKVAIRKVQSIVEGIVYGSKVFIQKIQEGYKEIYNYFRETPQFFQSAKNSAISIVTSLVKQLYDENADINVSVVFI